MFDVFRGYCIPILLCSSLLPGSTLAQIHPPGALLLIAPSVRLGEDEPSVRRTLKVAEPLYASPFAPSRLTLKAPNGMYLDFARGKVVEIDYTSDAAGVRLGTVGVGSSLADAKATLGSLTEQSPSELLYTAAGGELVQLRIRAGDQKVAVIAIVGDKTHPFVRNRPGKIVLQNQ